jgi:hypothetical protein
LHIQRWFAIGSPKEMSEAFTLASALYYIAETRGSGAASACAIERQIGQIEDPSEWFAACMYVEDLRQNQPLEVRWSAVR